MAIVEQGVARRDVRSTDQVSEPVTQRRYTPKGYYEVRQEIQRRQQLQREQQQQEIIRRPPPGITVSRQESGAVFTRVTLRPGESSNLRWQDETTFGGTITSAPKLQYGIPPTPRALHPLKQAGSGISQWVGRTLIGDTSDDLYIAPDVRRVPGVTPTDIKTFLVTLPSTTYGAGAYGTVARSLSVYPKVAKVLRYGVQPAMMGAFGGYAAADIARTWESGRITQFKVFTYAAHIGAAIKGVYRFRPPEQIAGLRLTRLSRSGYSQLRIGAPQEKFISLSRFTRGEGLFKYQELTQWRTGTNKFLYGETAPGRYFDIRGAPIEFMGRSKAIALGMGEFKGFKAGTTTAEPMVRTTMLSRMQLVKEPFTYKQLLLESRQPPTMRYTPITKLGKFTPFTEPTPPKTTTIATGYTGGGKPIGTTGASLLRHIVRGKPSFLSFLDTEYVPMSRLTPPQLTRTPLMMTLSTQIKADTKTWIRNTAIVAPTHHIQRMMTIQPQKVIQVTKPSTTSMFQSSQKTMSGVLSRQATAMSQMMKQEQTYMSPSEITPLLLGGFPVKLTGGPLDAFGRRRKGKPWYRFREFKIPSLLELKL